VEWVKYDEIFFIFLLFANSPTCQTGRRIFARDGSNDAQSHKDVPFGGFVTLLALRIKSHKTFWRHEYAFSRQKKFAIMPKGQVGSPRNLVGQPVVSCKRGTKGLMPRSHRIRRRNATQVNVRRRTLPDGAACRRKPGACTASS